MNAADRRSTPRTRVDLFFNKYIDGYPYMCRLLDVSDSGLMLERIGEPALPRELFPIEIAAMEQHEGAQYDAPSPERLWLWAKQVWSDGSRQALEFVDVEERDKKRLARILERAGYAAAAA